MFKNYLFKKLFVAAMLSAVSFAINAADGDLDAIRAELKLLRESYQLKIQQLEQRLEEAEAANESNAEKTEELAIEVSQKGNQRSANTYNPGIGVILNGHLLSSDSEQEFNIPGFMLADEVGPGAEGFELGESEVNINANVDDKFYASVTLAFGEGAGVEEAYLQTISLPYGFSIKAGRFFSSIGYLASRHTHSDDFSERPLAYEAFLGGQFGDDGVQLTYLAATEIFWESGFELFRGDSFPAAGAADNGNGVWTAFTHFGDDINDSQSWRLGLSYLNANVDQRTSLEGESFSGESDLWIADFVWKWSPNGNSKITNAKIQAEYLSRDEKGIFNDTLGNNYLYDASQDGWYVQGIYQFMPQWRVGTRYSQLSADDLGADFSETILNNLNQQPKRFSLMLDWSNSEFSRFRLQYSQQKIQTETSNIWTLQYIAAFGAHGAHSF